LMGELMPKLCELAYVEKTCDMLADEMERTRRRVNALEYVMIPEMKTNIKYISMKLADNELGNLTRLMKVKELMAAQETS
ncbi:MAG: V-type ATP synthase subunit D, partial [Clostridia bacterium]